MEVSSSVDDHSDSVFQDDSLPPHHCEEKVTDDVTIDDSSRKLRHRKTSEVLQQSDITKKIRSVVKKPHLSTDDALFLEENRYLVKMMENRKLAYSKAKERAKEVLDEDSVIDAKVEELAEVLRSSKHAVVYTGAGISTSANIPDYRGANGVWTQLCAGQSVKLNQNFSSAIPTFTHMALSKLVETGIVKYIVSQNCDGLHIRSGMTSSNLAEIHGNMFAEICSSCSKSYYRVFDVSEKTALRRHFTNRHCDVCGGSGLLKDTIVHFGEYSDPKWPHNWNEADDNVKKSDLIICLGSSLKVLRSYKQLWLTSRPKHQRPKLCIVNIQWTPKDSQAKIKINGRTDQVMMKLMKCLQLEVPPYSRENDPLFQLAIPLKPEQHSSFRSVPLAIPEEFRAKFAEACRNNVTPSSSITSALADSFPECSNRSTKVERMSSFPGELSSQDRSLLVDEEDTKSSGPNATPVVESPQFVEPPAWFGKGRRKIVKKKGKIKRRRKTT